MLFIGFIYWSYLPSLNSSNLSIDFQTTLSTSHQAEDFFNSTIQKNLPSRKVDRNQLDKQKLKEWMRKMEKKYSKAKERIKRVCKKYNIPSRKTVHWESLMADTHYKVALCSISKAGSTTWRHHYLNFLSNKTQEGLRKKYGNHFLNMKGIMKRTFWRIPEKELPGISGDLIPPNVVNQFLKNNKILTFAFVRHPFERLVSAYNDRILNIDNRKHHFVEARGYKEWYDHDHSFPAFVDLVLNEYHQDCFAGKTQTSFMYQAKSYQSKCEFKINEHWNPYASRCSFCDVDYDLIGHMETWSDDLNFIIRKQGLEKVIALENSSTTHHSTKGNTQRMTKSYFSKLTKKQGTDLYNMYHMDFEMFNYDPKIYL